MKAHQDITIRELIELQRATSPVEPQLSELPIRVGRLISALGFLETYAGQVAGPWVFGVMDDREFLSFTRIADLDRVDECCAIIEEVTDRLRDDPEARHVADRLDAVWPPVLALIDRLRAAEDARVLIELVGQFLFAAMIVHEDLEATVFGQDKTFTMASRNTGREFALAAIARLGWSPFGCREGEPLDALRGRMIEELKSL